MTTSSQGAVRQSGATTGDHANHANHVSVQRRHSTETKASFKTTEMVFYVLAVVGVLIASYAVKTTSGHADYFRADKAWFYIVLLTLGYLGSRGLAKSGSREHYDD